MTSVEDPPPQLDKRKVRLSFDRAAPGYDEIADLQRTVGHRLLDHLTPVALSPRVVLDMGAGTGYCLTPLAQRYPQATLIALDLAEGMLKVARNRTRACPAHYLCGDAEGLPLAQGSIDLLFSNVTVQWCNDLSRTCQEFYRVLAPQGRIVFSTFGPDTLWELRKSWASADGHQHVSTFVDMHDIGDRMLAVGFRDVVLDVDRITRTYPNVDALMRELKGLGAHNASQQRPRALTSRQRLTAMAQAYEARRQPAGIPATFEVIYAFGRRP